MKRACTCWETCNWLCLNNKDQSLKTFPRRCRFEIHFTASSCSSNLEFCFELATALMNDWNEKRSKRALDATCTEALICSASRLERIFKNLKWFNLSKQTRFICITLLLWRRLENNNMGPNWCQAKKARRRAKAVAALDRRSFAAEILKACRCQRAKHLRKERSYDNVSW